LDYFSQLQCISRWHVIKALLTFCQHQLGETEYTNT